MGKMETIKTKIKRMGLKQKTVMFTMLFFLFVVILSSVTFFFIYKNMRKETIEKAMDSVVRQKKDEIRGILTIWKPLLTVWGILPGCKR